MNDADLPIGFEFAGVYTGVKRNPEKKDLTLIVSQSPASAAGMFTTNQVCAAPVQVSKSRVPSNDIRAVVINSGNANACTGDQGMSDARQMAEVTAQHIGAKPEQVLVCSTGVIGRLMPMDKIVPGINLASEQLGSSAEHFDLASRGIMTTDTGPKTAERSLRIGSGTVNIVGFAKGAAMIGPNMATMLGFVLTDAGLTKHDLDQLLKSAVDRSFHCISVEGHTSTNDTVLALANHGSGVHVGESEMARFADAFTAVCCDLSQAIINDAEGVTHVLTIDVRGLSSYRDAKQVAKTIADSALVKAAVFGNDPNWGRICSAAGYSGIKFAERQLSLRVNGTLLYDRGQPTKFDPTTESERMKANRDVAIELFFEMTGPTERPSQDSLLGPNDCRFWTSDLSYEYVRQNAEYTT